ncbi:hypothetical protein GH714_041746 [Hevea brasiliensis]|uniref:Leucine-rich repeat-containing N-terminal plant-type domain-containing protein n=1 Tax=Hevea brasiliensis TaxID=3981 RepID=A0A6A6MUZ3_HEVBR|nr:hypothetical protein GH714_041746 [Hevea brasiliensis]
MNATSFTLAFPWFLFAAAVFSLGLCHGSFNAGCIESEREALLQFKLGLKDPSNRLSSWDRDVDCCEWPGVICDNLTNHVLELHLRSLSENEYYGSNATGDYYEYMERSTFRGKISQSLLNLKHLKCLGLSNNNFEGIHIPKFLGSMKSLRYLNFSGAGFGGMIPHQLGNLSNLQYLNLEAAVFSLGLCHGSFNAGCIESEREALLQFKLGLKDPSNRLSSWDRDVDCCEWPGVICDNLTNHVLELHLRSLSENEYYGSNATGDYYEYMERSTFRGKISQSLLNLKHLKCLGLSNNNFEGIHIPKFLGSMKSLRYLNFSGAGFGGMIPHQLGNLSNLQYLNLEGDGYYYYEIYVENLDWISNLSSLEFLDLSSVDLSKALDWLDAMNKLPSLVELHLSYCSLNHKLDFSHSNFDFS